MSLHRLYSLRFVLALLAVAGLICSLGAALRPDRAFSATGRTVAAVSAPRSPSTGSPVSGALTSGSHKMLVIIFENHSASEALAGMPYLASLARTYGQATDYRAITHPSLPNYFAIWGGSTFGVHTNCSVGSTGCVPPAPSIWGQTLSAGKTAKAYQESMTRNCQTSSAGSYAPRHGPWPYWTNSTERARCDRFDVPSGTTTSGALHNAVAAGTLPVTGELTPNLCHDAHNCSLSVANSWLSGWMRQIIAARDFKAGRLTVVITFDEDDGTQGNRVALVVVDPRLSHKTVSGSFNHFSLARWLEENAGVALLRHAASAPDLRAAFRLR